MRLASWLAGQQASWGVVAGGTLADLGPSGAAISESLRSVLVEELLPTLTPARIAAAPVLSADDVTWLPVIPDPAKILCVGMNYRTHLAETKRPAQAAPTLFTRFPDSQAAHNANVEIPAVAKDFDYEGEVAVVIGRPTWHADAAEVMANVAGYSIYNDFTARDWQRATSQWTPGKNFPGTGAFGPALVTADEVGDVSTARLETRVNGELRQGACVSDLICDIPNLLAYISTFTPLSPGDVVVTGTPGGVGAFMDPPNLLKSGDVVEVTVTTLGTLKNTVLAAPTNND